MCRKLVRKKEKGCRWGEVSSKVRRVDIYTFGNEGCSCFGSPATTPNIEATSQVAETARGLKLTLANNNKNKKWKMRNTKGLRWWQLRCGYCYVFLLEWWSGYRGTGSDYQQWLSHDDITMISEWYHNDITMISPWDITVIDYHDATMEP